MINFHRLCLIAVVPLLLTACSGTGSKTTPTTTPKTATGSTTKQTPRSNSSQKYFSLDNASSSGVKKDAMMAKSSAKPVVYDLTKTSAATGDAMMAKKQADVHVEVRVSQTEVKPGAQLTYTITATNNSDITLDGYSVVHSFNGEQLKVVSANGRRDGDAIQWVLTGLKPGASKTLTFKARAASRLALGDVIRTSTIVLYGTTVQPQTGNLEVLVVNKMPATGAAANTDPLEDTRQFIRPYQS
jgi:Domain of unknown function DUF11